MPWPTSRSKLLPGRGPLFSEFACDHEVWPTFENFNLGHNFQTRRCRTFILKMCISCGMTFHMVPYFFPRYLDLDVWPTFEIKDLNLGYNFQTRRGRAFILYIYIPCDKTFHMVPEGLTLTLKFDLLFENLNLGCYNVFSDSCHPASVVFFWIRGQYIVKYEQFVDFMKSSF